MLKYKDDFVPNITLLAAPTACYRVLFIAEARLAIRLDLSMDLDCQKEQASRSDIWLCSLCCLIKHRVVLFQHAVQLTPWRTVTPRAPAACHGGPFKRRMPTVPWRTVGITSC